MPSHVIDSLLFRDMYGAEPLRQVFSDENMVQCWLDYEAALARAEAAVGLIPAAAAEEITRKARVEYLDLAAMKKGIDEAVHELVPMVWQLARLCEGDAGGYVHWGATTQDVTDTGLVMQMRQAQAIILADLEALAEELAASARRERDTIMPGRTHGQHALPITFGYKVAIWLSEVRRHIERLQQLAPRVFVGQFAGAAGTLASVGTQGLEIQRLMLADLGLGVPDIGWHPARDRLAEWASTLALIAATMGKIAHEIILLQKTEVAEIEEPYQRGKVGSSTMPHKRNPMLCEGIQGAARLTRGLVPGILAAMEAEHERDWASMHIEWAVIPEIGIFTGGTVAHALRAIRGLIVYRDRMRRNVGILHGLILSEAVMLRLGEYLGRQAAHEVVHEASMLAFEQQRPLADLLAEDERVTAHLLSGEIEELLRPDAYIGLCGYFVDQVAGVS
ncbi:MAG: adenylosuccinate lyase [Caldilineales bacterium]|nr:adenylosuccinate lyase [Caldilineales bacterium]